MGGAPPLPLDFAPQGVKKGTFLGPEDRAPRAPGGPSEAPRGDPRGVWTPRQGGQYHSARPTLVSKSAEAAMVGGGARGPPTIALLVPSHLMSASAVNPAPCHPLCRACSKQDPNTSGGTETQPMHRLCAIRHWRQCNANGGHTIGVDGTTLRYTVHYRPLSHCMLDAMHGGGHPHPHWRGVPLGGPPGRTPPGHPPGRGGPGGEKKVHIFEGI